MGIKKSMMKFMIGNMSPDEKKEIRKAASSTYWGHWPRKVR